MMCDPYRVIGPDVRVKRMSGSGKPDPTENISLFGGVDPDRPQRGHSMSAPGNAGGPGAMTPIRFGLLS